MDNTLTKHELIAAMAMQGMLAKYAMNTPSDQITICQMAVQLSNELLKQLSDGNRNLSQQGEAC